MLQLFRKERVLPQAHDLRRTYDVVIIGAGVHGLATAYYLGKEHGITNVAVLEKSYLGAGNSGRNTAILRANYRTPEGIPFFAASLELYEQLSQELGWNVLFSQCGHLTLAHNDSAVAGLRLRAETNNLFGVENHVIDRAELQRPRPGPRLLRPRALPHPSRPLQPAGRHHPPRRRRLGLRPRLRAHGHRDSPFHRSHRHQRQRFHAASSRRWGRAGVGAYRQPSPASSPTGAR